PVSLKVVITSLHISFLFFQPRASGFTWLAIPERAHVPAPVWSQSVLGLFRALFLRRHQSFFAATFCCFFQSSACPALLLLSRGAERHSVNRARERTRMSAPSLVGSARSHPCVARDSGRLGVVFKRLRRPSMPVHISWDRGGESKLNARGTN